MSWWAGKVRRFGRYFTGRVGAAEKADLSAWLIGPQLALFDSMHPADQRHGLDVVAALRAEGHVQPELLLAGLLHDSGKGRALHVWHRVSWSLGERYGPRVERLLERLPTFHKAFGTMRDHAARSAELAAAAGCSAATADLIRNQAEPTDPVLGRALLLADRAN
ncbi:MAG TPA: hypothetical protein VM284_05835 [Candidatus Limnocylindria bacterium]|nr:hypothetical protein [Candidatus Limnocylindria bacterium]